MKRTAVFVAFVLLLTGCSSPTGDDAYLASVRADIPALSEVDDAELISLGGQMCETFDDRGLEEGMAQVIDSSADAGLNASNVSDLTRAAIDSYCPEYAN